MAQDCSQLFADTIDLNRCYDQTTKSDRSNPNYLDGAASSKKLVEILAKREDKIVFFLYWILCHDSFSMGDICFV